MRLFRQITWIAAAAFVSLLLVAGVLAGVVALDALDNTHALLRPSSVATAFFGATMLVGTLPALLIGVPGYLLLLRKGLARWYYVLALGVAPGCILLGINANLGAWGIACGAMVSMLTHWACRRLGATGATWQRQSTWWRFW